MRIENDLSAVSEKLDRTSFTKFRLQLVVEREDDRTSSWLESIKDQTSADSAAQPKKKDKPENEELFLKGLPSIPEFLRKSNHGFTAGKGASGDADLLDSDHLAFQQYQPKSNFCLYI